MKFYKNYSLAAISQSESEPVKRKTYKINRNGHEFTVIVKAESALIKEYSNKDTLYDVYEAKDHSLTREEVIKKYDNERKTDYYVNNARPEVTSHAIPLSESEIQSRKEFIIDIYRLINNKQIIELIIDFAPKKKNGTFYKKRHTRIVSSATVSDDYYIFEIEGYAVEDTKLEIRGIWVDFDNELENVEDDFISQYPSIINGKIPEIHNKILPEIDTDHTYIPGTVYMKVYSGFSELNIKFEIENGEKKIAGYPISKFNCLKEDDSGKYYIYARSPSLEKIAGREYNGYIIDNTLSEPTEMFRYTFQCLLSNNFTPFDDEITELVNDLHDYYLASNLKYTRDIKEWPRGIEKYNPKYTKEESLVLLLKMIDKICSITDDEVNNILNKLAKTKSTGAIKPNQNISLYTENFFVPDRGNGDFDSIHNGFVPELMIRSPMNYPLKQICICISSKHVYTD